MQRKSRGHLPGHLFRRTSRIISCCPVAAPNLHDLEHDADMLGRLNLTRGLAARKDAAAQRLRQF
jgi:hypothetical protein